MLLKPSLSRPVLAGRYAVLGGAGEGGMGIVYRGFDRVQGCQVAIKVMRSKWLSHRRVVERFANEGHALRRIEHPMVSRLLATGQTDDGLPYMVMEWIDGSPLGWLLKTTRRLSLARIARLGDQLLRALETIHRAGVVHGDLKPDNLLIVNPGPRESLKVIDFGLAHLESAPLRNPLRDCDNRRHVSGTPEYMAPELIRGATPTPAVDLYAVGVLLYQLLTGQPPFAGRDPGEVIALHLDEAPVRPSLRYRERVLPAGLDDLILCALAKRPGERPHSAHAMAEVLAAVLRQVAGSREVEAGQTGPQARLAASA